MSSNQLETGVPNLDLILGGGIPEGDTLLVVGSAGAGKTTLAFQVAFDLASRQQNVIYVSTLSELHFSPHQVSFLTDDIILQRYVELDGQLRKVMAVVKMRSSGHSKDLRAYAITPRGIVVGETLGEYRGIITGVPELRGARIPLYPGLTEEETAVMEALVAIKEGAADAVARTTDLPPEVVEKALQRLVALNYAVRAEEEGRVVFRPLARALGK